MEPSFMSGDEELGLEWEDWDRKSPFIHHCIAGSLAGVTEHTLLYPVDTVKTHMQACCSVCPNNPFNSTFNESSSLSSMMENPHRKLNLQQHGMWSTMRNIMNNSHNFLPVSVYSPATNRQTPSS